MYICIIKIEMYYIFYQYVLTNQLDNAYIFKSVNIDILYHILWWPGSSSGR